ncbi:unnamed protein product [Discosporangium mesarthrocarpum]
MGGGRRFHYPKYVWSPSGGWWGNPANWKQNTAVALVCIGITCAGIFKVSADREVCPVPYAGCFFSPASVCFLVALGVDHLGRTLWDKCLVLQQSLGLGLDFTGRACQTEAQDKRSF